MTDDELKAARALCDAATPGPWAVSNDPFSNMVVDTDGTWVADVGIAPRDAAFIAAARALVPALIDEVERLRTVTELRGDRDYVAADRDRLRAALTEALNRLDAHVGALRCTFDRGGPMDEVITTDETRIAELRKLVGGGE